jgi:hypothetical protein
MMHRVYQACGDFVCNPLAKANGNDKCKLFLQFLIHCRPIYGTDRETRKWALAQTLIFRTPMMITPATG